MFYYELHAHTSTSSLCSIVHPEDYVQFYLDMGYSGMVVTDHFYYGNTAINRRLDWEDFVDAFCEGYYRAKEEGDKHGFKVFFGFEQKFMDGSDEYIVLGISPEWLKHHPEIRDMARDPFFKTIRAAGGFVIQAHPYRVRYYISSIRLSLDNVDAIEVMNMGDSEVQSRQAYEYAKNLGLPMTAGTDNHSIIDRTEVGGLAFEKEIMSVEELIEEIKESRVKLAPEDRFERIKNTKLEDPYLEVYALEGGELKPTENYFAENERESV